MRRYIISFIPLRQDYLKNLTLNNDTAKDVDAIEPQIDSDKSKLCVICSQGNFGQSLTDNTKLNNRAFGLRGRSTL